MLQGWGIYVCLCYHGYLETKCSGTLIMVIVL